jgi:hypothetical protein
VFCRVLGGRTDPPAGSWPRTTARGTIPCVGWDQVTAIVVTVVPAVLAGTLYNNRRIDDVHRRIDDLRADMNARFAQVDTRLGRVETRVGELRGELQVVRQELKEEIREVRALLQEVLRARTS